MVMAVGALLPGAASAATPVSLVSYGLDSPRGIDFLGASAIVGEAGHGGSTCFAPMGGGPPGAQACVGPSSQISRVNTSTGAHSAITTGLFSLAGGPETLGVSGISVRNGVVYAIIAGTPQELPDAVTLGKQQAGHLIAVNPSNGSWRSVSSVGAADFEFTKQFTEPDPRWFQTGNPAFFNPNAQEHDANPNDVKATGDGWLVVDAGANTLTMVGKNGETEVVHHFQFNNPVPFSFPSDSVPTCVAVADGDVWVGTLSGHLYKVEDETATEVVPRDSNGKALLTHVTGCTAGKDGTLYLVNMFGAGAPFQSATFFRGSVVRFNTDRGTGSELADSFSSPSLTLPYMPAIGPDGNLYVTAGTICNSAGDSPFPPGAPNPCMAGGKPGGKVVRIDLPRPRED